MSSFERDLLDDCSISFTDAADFYLGIKKQAAPVDPREEVEDAARKGVLAGITQSEKNILVDRDSRGERTGRAVGNVLGTVGGAAAGHKLLKGPTGALVGGALGYAAGGSAGKEVGRGRDIARHRKYASLEKAAVSHKWVRDRVLAAAKTVPKGRVQDFAEGIEHNLGAPQSYPMGSWGKHETAAIAARDALAKKACAMRFKLACMKLADGPMGDMGGAMSSPTAGQELQPVNYLQAEQLAQQAQSAQEGTFYRMRAQQAEQMAQAVQQQMAQTQQELQALQMQAEQTGQQVQQGMQEALAARDDALKQTQIAANLRLGMQKLRQQMLEVASQDPAEVAASELQGQAQAEQEAQMAAAQGVDPAAAGGAPPASPAKAGKEVEEATRAQDEAVTQTQQAEMAAGAPQPQGMPAPGATPSPSGGASLDSMDPSGVMKQGAAIPKAKGLRRVGELLTGSRVGKLKDRTDRRIGLASRALGERTNKLRGEFEEAHNAATREGAPLPWREQANRVAKGKLKSLETTTRRARRVTAGANDDAREWAREGTKVFATRAGAGLGALGLGTAGAVVAYDNRKKTAAISPQLLRAGVGAGVGAGLGAAAGGYGAYLERQGAGDLRQRVQAMEAQEQGGFRQAMQLAALKGRAAMAEAGEQNPGAHTAYGALTGAASGAALGSSLAGIGGQVIRHLSPYGG